jgi:hypothetical protein
LGLILICLIKISETICFDSGLVENQMLTNCDLTKIYKF